MSLGIGTTNAFVRFPIVGLAHQRLIVLHVPQIAFLFRIQKDLVRPLAKKRANLVASAKLGLGLPTLSNITVLSVLWGVSFVITLQILAVVLSVKTRSIR